MSDYANQSNPQYQNKGQHQSKGNKPKDTLWDGPLKMAIFENARENGVSYSTEPGRIYTDAQGQVRESKSFSHGETLRLSKLSDKAYDRISEFKQQMKAQNRGQDRDR
ncbi:hypothetical protein QSV34_10765 [Porticoccus sp. W117]|uniref:hypothetical protein n=1 Tax=Porticoccus sp. W117 TaxID=3054777 RepID=UPI0025940DE2|nr:hypothetical protein [Porticoccus sp. W117]MDM3871831.1 hypothetical protein [Porticoccus sp. W117]